MVDGGRAEYSPPLVCLKQTNKLIWSQCATIDPRIRLPLVYNSACPLGPRSRWSEHGITASLPFVSNSRSIQSKVANRSSPQLSGHGALWATSLENCKFLPCSQLDFFSSSSSPPPHSMNLWWLVAHGREQFYNLLEGAHLEECVWFVVRNFLFQSWDGLVFNIILRTVLVLFFVFLVCLVLLFLEKLLSIWLFLKRYMCPGQGFKYQPPNLASLLITDSWQLWTMWYKS